MKVRDCFDLNPSGNTNKYTDYINYIDTASVNAGVLDGVSYLDEDFPSRAQRLVLQGDILYSSVRPNLRHYYLYKDSFEHVVASTGFVLLRNKSDYNTEFAFYYLTTKEIVKHLSNIAELSQSTYPSFLPKDLGAINLPEIDIAEQEKIVSILSAYDNLIEVNNKRIKVLEQMAENLYKEWFVYFRFPGYESAEFENGIPKGWGIDSVKETFEIFDTIRIPLSSIERDNMQKVYPYYGAAEILDYVEDYLFDGIYLLLGEDGSVMTPDGKPMLQYVWGQFWVNNHAHVLQGKLPFTTEFIYLMFKNTNVTGIVTGSAQPKISQGRLFKKKTIIPPSHIVEQFNRIITPLFDNIRSLSEINKNLIKQRDLLLPRLMSGKLEV